MEFVPRAPQTTVAPAEAARRRSIREAGVAAVAAALAMAEGAGSNAFSQTPAERDARMPLPQAA